MYKNRTTMARSGTAGILMTAAMASANAAFVYDESVEGDLSNDPAAPTAARFVARVSPPFSETIRGTVTANGDPRDFITFRVPDDFRIERVEIVHYEELDSGGPGNRGFHAFSAGATSFIPSPATAGAFLGGVHLDPVPSGTNVLPDLALAPLIGSGFDNYLRGPADYSYVIQQTSPNLTGYEIRLVTVYLPVPAALPLLGSALIGLAAWRVRKSAANRPCCMTQTAVDQSG